MYDEFGGVAIGIDPAQHAVILERGQDKKVDAVPFVFLVVNDVAVVHAAVFGLNGKVTGGHALPTAAV